jgi:hypothetical protein
MSAAMQDVLDEDRREREAAERRERAIAEQIVETHLRRHAARREQIRREADAVIASLIETHGRDVALAFVRRHVPDYDEGSE